MSLTISPANGFTVGQTQPSWFEMQQWGQGGPAAAANSAPVVPGSGVPGTVIPGAGAVPVPTFSTNTGGGAGGMGGMGDFGNFGGAAPTQGDIDAAGAAGDAGFNWGRFSNILEGVGTLGKVWAGIQANKISREGLQLKKDAYKTNLANQTQSYNTALQDRAWARAAQTGQAEGQTRDYIANNRL